MEEKLNQDDRALGDIYDFSDVQGEHGSPTRLESLFPSKPSSPLSSSARPSDDLLTLAPRKKSPVAGRRARDADKRVRRRVMFADTDDVVEKSGAVSQRDSCREDTIDFRPMLKRTGTPYRARDDDTSQSRDNEKEHVTSTRHTWDHATSQSRLFDREYERLLKSASFDPSTDPLIRAYENRQTIIKSTKSSRCAVRGDTSKHPALDESSSGNDGKPSRYSRRHTRPRTPPGDDIFSDDITSDVDKEIQLAIEMGKDMSRFHSNMYDTRDLSTPVGYYRDVKTPVIDVMFQSKSQAACKKLFDFSLTNEPCLNATTTFKSHVDGRSEGIKGANRSTDNSKHSDLDESINKLLWPEDSHVGMSPTNLSRRRTQELQWDNNLAKIGAGLKSKLRKERVIDPDDTCTVGPAMEYSDVVSEATRRKINEHF